MNSFSLSSLLRENIKNIRPYSTARDEYSGVALVNLDANENPFGAVDGSANNRYPDPYQTPLKQVVAHIKGVPANQIFLGNGSDEGIDLIFKAFCNPGVDTAIICPPTYGMYSVSADINDVRCVAISLTDDFQLQTEKMMQAIDEHTKLIWICSPNNPSGNLIKRADIELVLNNFNGMVIIDEAYIDFAEEPSWTLSLEQYPNLIVLQTFSKAWGLANIRLGMMFASREVIAVINKIKLPYNLNGVVQTLAQEILENHASTKDIFVRDILHERAWLVEQLQHIPTVQKIYPSDANFVLVKIENAHALYLYLVANGIIVRDRSKIELCENCLRITVGTHEENVLLVEKISKFVENE
ncbi:MAG: histidinol-phosphate transaminase [Bacteroidales bacterium]|jgi:histidinol-phosphate aminotransferase|nr:histidinol-phosphate transaminase [Bacteroidales bacterium]